MPPRAMFSNDGLQLLTFRGKCSHLRAKPAHLVSHLPLVPGASRLTPSSVRGVRPHSCARGADRVTFHPEHRPKFYAIAFKLDGHAHPGARIASGDVKSTPARSVHRRRRANGGHECFGFSAQLKVLAPGMEGFGRHVHDRLPLTRPESRSLLRSQDKST